MLRIEDRPTGTVAGAGTGGRRRPALAAAAVAAVLAGGVAAVVGPDLARELRDGRATGAVGEPAVQERPVEPAPVVAAGPPDVTPGGGGGAPEPGSADGVPAGTYGVRVLAEGRDARGRYVVVDRGRLSDGPPAEPGVDGTRPVLFDTGAVTERRRIDLAERYALEFARSGGEPSYGPGGWDDFVTEVGARPTGMLATVEVDGDGRLVSLTEPYRP